MTGSSEDLITHYGSCHCQSVKFKVVAPSSLTVYDCNCSICKMKRNIHFIVPSSRFHIKDGENQLTEYRFNSRQARHMFCKICGVQAFYIPRSNPDGVAVTLACIYSQTIGSVKIIQFDGQNWEAEIVNKKEIKLDS
ncbi:Mss4-like protein, partial [Paraphysoderma sedebokerense]